MIRRSETLRSQYFQESYSKNYALYISSYFFPRVQYVRICIKMFSHKNYLGHRCFCFRLCRSDQKADLSMNCISHAKLANVLLFQLGHKNPS